MVKLADVGFLTADGIDPGRIDGHAFGHDELGESELPAEKFLLRVGRRDQLKRSRKEYSGTYQVAGRAYSNSVLRR